METLTQSRANSNLKFPRVPIQTFHFIHEQQD